MFKQRGQTNFIISTIDAISAYNIIKTELRAIGISAIPMSSRLFLTIATLSLTKYPDNFAFSVKKRIRLSPTTIRKLEKKIVLMSGWLTLMAYDDFIDKLDSKREFIIDQLSRCLAGFLAGQSEEKPITAQRIRAIGKVWAKRLSGRGNGSATKHLIHELFNFQFLKREYATLSISDLIYTTTDKTFDDQANATIVAAVELGKEYASTSILIKEVAGIDYDLSWNLYFFLEHLTAAACGQINTPIQRNIKEINWRLFINTVYQKSNCFVDAIDCLRNIINHDRLMHTRFHQARFCEQFLDDTQDYYSDYKEGIVGYFQMELIFQGQIAKDLLMNIYKRDISNKSKALNITKLLQSHSYSVTHYGTASCFNEELLCFFKNNTLAIDENNHESFIRALMMELPSAKPMGIRELLLNRQKRYNTFVYHWERKDYNECNKILISSQIPEIMAMSFLKFMRGNKNLLSSLFKSHSNLWKFWVYYLIVVCSMKVFLLRYKLNKLLLK